MSDFIQTGSRRIVCNYNTQHDEKGRFSGTVGVPSAVDHDEFEKRHGDKETEALNEIRLVLTGQEKKLVAKASDGKLLGAVAYSLHHGDKMVKVAHLGSTGEVKGVGASLMKAIWKKAHGIGFGVRGQSTDDAMGFYKKLGVKLDKAGNFSIPASIVSDLHARS